MQNKHQMDHTKNIDQSSRRKNFKYYLEYITTKNKNRKLPEKAWASHRHTCCQDLSRQVPPQVHPMTKISFSYSRTTRKINFLLHTESQPQIRSDTPKGRTPPDWVNSCMTVATRETFESNFHFRILHGYIVNIVNVNFYSHQFCSWNVTSIKQLVAVSSFPRAFNENPIIWAHSTVHHPNLIGYLFNFKCRMVLIKYRLLLLFSCQNHSIWSLYNEKERSVVIFFILN